MQYMPGVRQPEGQEVFLHQWRFKHVGHLLERLLYTIANNITGGGKLLEARAGVDYIKVNFYRCHQV